MVFVDTSALYSSLDRDDRSHAMALDCWTALRRSRESLVTTNYVVLESCALLQRRLGIGAVRSLTENLLPTISVQWVTPEDHTRALATVLAANRRKLSLVDCTSFAVMRSGQIHRAFAFDQHFDEQGFETKLA